MAIDPTSAPKPFGLIQGGRADEPPPTQWRFTPERCRKSAWKALLAGVFYGTVAHSLYRIAKPSDEEELDILFKVSARADQQSTEIIPRTSQEATLRRMQLIGRHFFLETTSALMVIGFADLIRSGGRGRNLAVEALNPVRTIRDLFNNCISREEIPNGAALVARALGKKNPLTRIKFQAIPWPDVHEVNDGINAKGVAITGAALVIGALSAALAVLGVRNIPVMQPAPAGLGVTTNVSPFSSDQNLIL